VFYSVVVQSAVGTLAPSPEFRRDSSQHRQGSWRLTGMQTRIRPIAVATARSAAMVALAILLILVLLPAAIAAQAATAV